MHIWDTFGITLHPDGCNVIQFYLGGIHMTKTRKSIRSLVEGALFVALAQILSFLPLYKLPWGGSIDLSMLPILLFCCRWGFGPGMLASFAFGILQMLYEGGIAIGWQSILGDFLIAYAVLGFAGLFRGRFFAGATLACALRFAVHYIVGATIWAEYMPKTFFGMTMTTPWFYSALYNGAYMLPDLLLLLLAYALLSKTPAAPYLRGEDIPR